MTSNTVWGMGRSGRRTVVPPVRRGKYSPLPSPYAKKSFAMENDTSDSSRAIVSRAYRSASMIMSWCRWIAPLGKPVVPELYSQNAVSSLFVSAGSSSGEAAAIRSPRTSGASWSSPATMMCSR